MSTLLGGKDGVWKRHRLMRRLKTIKHDYARARISTSTREATWSLTFVVWQLSIKYERHKISEPARSIANVAGGSPEQVGLTNLAHNRLL